MQEYYIESSKSTPSVYFNPKRGILDIRGVSTSCNPISFYNHIHAYLDTFTDSSNTELTVNIALKHMNTSTSKCLYLLFNKIDKSDKFMKNTVVNWYYSSYDESSLSFGNQIKELFDNEWNMIKTDNEKPLNVGKFLATESLVAY